MTDAIWTGLTATQADGLACVSCGRNYLTSRVTRHSVGRSHTDSQVFACSDTCTPTALPVLTGGDQR
jgi:hypothetical protein